MAEDMAFIVFNFTESSKLTLCEYPARCSFRRYLSTRSLSAALKQPHHAGAAYRRRLIAVALHTVNSALSCNPFALRMRSACGIRRGGAFAYDIIHTGRNFKTVRPLVENLSSGSTVFFF